MKDNSDISQNTDASMTEEERMMLAGLGDLQSDGDTARVEVNPAELSPLDALAEPSLDSAGQDINLKMLMDIPVDVHVEIGQTRVTLRDLLRMGVGSVLELDRLAGQPADIIVNGKLIGQGDVVVVNETFGIRITKLVGVQERIQSL